MDDFGTAAWLHFAIGLIYTITVRHKYRPCINIYTHVNPHTCNAFSSTWTEKKPKRARESANKDGKKHGLSLARVIHISTRSTAVVVVIMLLQLV